MASIRDTNPSAANDDLHWALRPQLPGIAIAAWIMIVAGSVSALVAFSFIVAH
jgi:hypothetical protein